MLLPMLNVLYFYVSTSSSMCAVPNMAVFFLFVVCKFRAFPVRCSGTLQVILKRFQSPLILLMPHLFLYSTRALYSTIIAASPLITFLSPGIATSINIHVLFSVSWLRFPVCCLVCACWFHTLSSWLVYTDFYIIIIIIIITSSSSSDIHVEIVLLLETLDESPINSDWYIWIKSGSLTVPILGLYDVSWLVHEMTVVSLLNNHSAMKTCFFFGGGGVMVV